MAIIFSDIVRKTLSVSVILTSMSLIACSEDITDIAGLPDRIDYNWDVRPILSDNCFQCHGNDDAGLEAGLRLNVREAAIQALPESPGKFAVVPGSAENSEMIQRITSLDVDLRMPPESTHKTLSALEIEILRKWIDDGAEYKEHWAFISPESPQVPVTVFDAQVNNTVDSFVFKKLEEEGLVPSRQAEKEALINRVTLTLTGLPPSLEDIDSFVDDSSPDAYERLVDSLLSSTRYAEHMSAYWMDLARWSESDGFLDDHHDRTLWPWRDWVINAFDSNMPFDQFGTAQLAGDLLANPSREQILASAFLRVGKRTTENGAIEEEYKAETMIERTDNALGMAFMGLSLGCARCHDHRYDPISQNDYYSLGAFFNRNDEPGVYAPGFSGIQGGPTLPWADPETQSQIDELASALEQREVAYNTARSLAADSGSDGENLFPQSGDLLVALIQSSMDKALTAYYPLDSATPVALTDLPPSRPSRQAPPSIQKLKTEDLQLTGLLSTEEVAANAAQPELTPEQLEQMQFFADLMKVPQGWVAEELELSPAGSSGVAAAVLQGPVFDKGIVGNAMFFNETNRGFLGMDVGWYDRSEPFTIDFWFYANESYENVPVINHRTEQNAGSTGYSFQIEEGHLWLRLAHSPPANMIALKSIDLFPVQEWTHITLAYDGSSKAAGTKIYFNGALMEFEIDHDTLTRTMLPWTSGDAFEQFLGLSFGTRFREKAPVGSGIDEMRFFNKQLTALEVAYLHDEEAVLRGDSATLESGLRDLMTSLDENVVNTQQALTAAREAHNEAVSVVPQVLVMHDLPEPVDTFVLGRGLYSNPEEQVYPKGLESVFEWDDSLPANRLGLAQWLFDENNPLTARVFVNRIWQMHFGRGIVETSEDFGSQGSIPTHPQLLDALTIEFVESGWDIKALHKLIVSSATYQQSSVVSDELLEKDARNVLLARGPSWRMTAEMVRDQVLSVSDLLSERVGGESAFPYQPAGIWNPGNSMYDYPEPEDINAEEHHRRTLYTFIKRNAMNPALSIFDYTNRTESKSRRSSSNTPLQSLTLMNDPQFMEAYRTLATVVLKEEGSRDEQLIRLYRLATRKTPSAAAFDLVSQYYISQRELMSTNDEKVRNILSIGVTEPDPTLDSAELAAMTSVAAMVMNSPDAYTVQ